MFSKYISKKTVLPAAFLLIFLLTMHSFSHLSFVFTENVFQKLTQTIFQNEVSSSTLTLHYTLKDPQSCGISGIPVRYQSEEDPETLLPIYLRLLSDLDADALSRSDQITYDALLLLLNQEQSASIFSCYPEPLGATIGIQAQLPVLLAEYRFDSAGDIQTYLQLLSGTDQYFSSLLAYERQKAAKGLFMPSTNADAIIAQCRSFSEVPLSEHLLVTAFEQKLSAMTALSAEEKAALQKKNRSIVQQHVLPAYQLLANGLTDLKKFCRNELGLAHLPQGRAYYEYLVQASTGSALSVPSIQNRIQKQLLSDAADCRRILSEYPDAVTLSPELFSENPQEILLDLQEKMKDDFPAIPATSYELKYVDSSLSSYLSPAFYLTAPIDDPDQNIIYLNPSAGYTGLDLYTTLAHEGFPGHLYQNRYCVSTLSPLRSLLNFGGYTEGWATYVEMLSYNYAARGCSPKEAAAISLAQKQRSMLLGLSSLIDIFVHYHGFTRSDIQTFLSQMGFSDGHVADSIYDAVLESPANYLKYDLGYLTFQDLRSWCQKKWPEQFRLSTFHQHILEIGPCQFPVLEKYLELCYTNS